ncbi:hypothetical protein J7T55_012923 [Diaporthe amygdali]|uniref:uncharacterized protein n=1 Tax=Phomopsis amygdali TaxID=1214568 RepID=UPI0022FEF2C3|nr:uncharacterized protein J7T55_012923 [Diaporthe amygdali]KAJ0118669.1 hypothetical protein J7T55_012923 [Diaporthe amygdali]
MAKVDLLQFAPNDKEIESQTWARSPQASLARYGGFDWFFDADCPKTEQAGYVTIDVGGKGSQAGTLHRVSASNDNPCVPAQTLFEEGRVRSRVGISANSFGVACDYRFDILQIVESGRCQVERAVDSFTT